MPPNISSTKKIAIVGAGPIGLEAALFGIQAGFRVSVFEKGQVAQSLREWGHVQLFSPFSMNSSHWGREALEVSPIDYQIPNTDALLTGIRLAEQYLEPLSQLPELISCIHENTLVQSISRENFWKGDAIGKSSRETDPFQLLISDEQGQRTVQADYVFDCSGTYPNHNWLGAGGIPAVGEASTAQQIDYTIPDILGIHRSRFAGKKTLVVGSGYSAATAIVSLSQLAEKASGTQAHWITKSDRNPPMTRIEDDQLLARDKLSQMANHLATTDSSPVHWLPNRLIRKIEKAQTGQLQISFRHRSDESDIETVAIDQIIANVGYRPDRSLYEELQIHECYASGGPIKLAAALLGETSADCLSQSGQSAETLVNPEPNFFILGAKSYGRDSRFLLKIGHQQIRNVFSLISQTGQTKEEVSTAKAGES